MAHALKAPASLISVGLALAAGPLKAADTPNVLLIAIDDLNDWIGCLGGHPQVKTPNLDRLAARGTVLINAHCQAPQCNPSRTSLLTGLRPSTTGIYALDGWFRDCSPLKDWVTLPQYFAAHGYRTLSTGKVFHDAYPPPEGRKNGTEFTVWGYPGSFGPFPPKPFVETPAHHPLIDWGTFPERDEQTDDWKVTDWAIEHLRALPRTQPFFMCVGLRRPHVPCYAPGKWFDLYPLDNLVLPPVNADDRADTPRFSWYLHWRLPEPRLAWLQANSQWKPLVQAYLACVSFVDSQVGRLLDALESAGLADRTIIVLFGDNGWHLGEKAITGKTSLWDRSTHVPLVLAGRGITAGGRCSRPAELLDIYPTLVELAGLPARPELEGHSLVPQLKDAQVPRPWPAICTAGQNNHAIRTEQWRYIRYADGSEELYDMTSDRNEWDNLASDAGHAAIKQELVRWLPAVNKRPMPACVIRLTEFRDGKVYWEGEPVDPRAEPE